MESIGTACLMDAPNHLQVDLRGGAEGDAGVRHPCRHSHVHRTASRQGFAKAADNNKVGNAMKDPGWAAPLASDRMAQTAAPRATCIP